jgi:hypothetical protein
MIPETPDMPRVRNEGVPVPNPDIGRTPAGPEVRPLAADQESAGKGPARKARKPMPKKIWSPMKTKLMRGLAQGKTGKDAARAAGYSPSSASMIASRSMADPDFRTELRAMMDRIGATKEKLMTRINEGLDATAKTYAISDGKITDERVDPDFEVRGKYIDRAAKVRGDLGYVTGENEGGGMSVAVMVNIIREQSARRGLPL